MEDRPIYGDRDPLASATATIETSLRSALALTCDVTGLRYGAPTEALVAAIVTELRSPAIAWALRVMADDAGAPKPRPAEDGDDTCDATLPVRDGTITGVPRWWARCVSERHATRVGVPQSWIRPYPPPGGFTEDPRVRRSVFGCDTCHREQKVSAPTGERP